VGNAAADSLRAWYGNDTTVGVGSVADTPRSLLLIAPAGLKSEVKRAAYATLSMPDIGTPGETWLLGRDIVLTESRWLWLLGCTALGYLLLAAALANARDVLGTRSTGALAARTTLAVVLGVLIATWLGHFLVAALERATFPWGAALVAACASSGLVLSTLVAALPRRLEAGAVRAATGGLSGVNDAQKA
jgi:hypothetical protein